MKIVSSILMVVLIVDVDLDLDERTKIGMPDAQVSITIRLFSYINTFKATRESQEHHLYLLFQFKKDA